MNAVERVLYEDITCLVDRLATSVPPGGVSRTLTPALRARLDVAEAQMVQARTSIIEEYGRWRKALEDVENLWALAAWHSAAAEEPGEQAAALAA